MRFIARTALSLTAVAALVGCDRSIEPAAEPAVPTEVAAPATTPAAPVQATGGLAIEGEGLRIFDAEGAARALPFGTPQETVIAAVTATTGGVAPEQSTNAECGQGPVQQAAYANGLQLLFQGEEFRGWFLSEAGLTTVDGIGVGATRAALNAARTVEIQTDSTLGIEFTAGDIMGFLTAADASGTVESLYAGETCFFR
jgi:hypothetical protein